MPTELSLTRTLQHTAKWSFTSRRVKRDHAVRLERDVARAATGDLLLGRVALVGAHRRLQLAAGRYADLYEGDVVVLACGCRYASEQFEGIASIDPAGADLLAGGGLVGHVRQAHQRMQPPTRILPIGLLGNPQNRILNVRDYALPARRGGRPPLVVGVLGSAMNSGKTVAAASLVHGLARAGHAVAGIKGTGTGAFGDINAYADAGATFVADFTDAGLVSTYRQPLAGVEAALDTLLVHASAAGAEVAVVEIADGVFQAETAALVRSPRVHRLFDGFVFAAGDPLAATAGATWLAGVGIVPAATTGLLSRSPLAASEAEDATGIAVLTREDLRDPAGATALLARVRAGGRAAGTTAA